MGKVEAARELRYNFFHKAANELSAKQGSQTVRIATAHNADDLAETIIINLVRGAGLSGISGIPPRRGSIIRPLLHTTRDEIEEYINKKSIDHIEDSSNSLHNQVRNKLRHLVFPVLREINPRFTDAAVRTAQLSRLDEEYIASLADEYIAGISIDSKILSAKDISSLPYPIKSRVIRKIGSNKLSHEHVSAILDLIMAGKPSASLSLPGMRVYREYDKVFFEYNVDSTGKKDRNAAERSRFAPIQINPGSEIFIPEVGLKVLCNLVECNEAHVDALLSKPPSLQAAPPNQVQDRLCSPNYSEETVLIKTFCTFLFHVGDICGTISVGSRSEGDKIKLLGSNHTKSLKKLFIEKRIPAAKRDLVPVIYDEKGTLAVYGICRSNRALPKKGKKAMRVQFIIHNS
jgi:tRNA(Ile)-lysidine synthase